MTADSSQKIEFGFSPWRTVPLALTMSLILLAGLAAGIAAAVGYGTRDNSALQWIFGVGLLPLLLVSEGACVYTVWLIARGESNAVSARVRACSDGIELNAAGTKRVLWTEIARFEKGAVKIDDEGNSFVTPIMVLRNGDRIELQALSRASFFGRWQRHVVEIGKRIQGLNQLLEQANDTSDTRNKPT